MPAHTQGRLFQKKGRHRAPRAPLPKAAVAVPVVLLTAGGGALAGLGGTPSLADARVRVAAAADLGPLPVALPLTSLGKELAAASAGRTAGTTDEQEQREDARTRATRSGRAALAAQGAADRAAEQASTAARRAAVKQAAARATAASRAAARQAEVRRVALKKAAAQKAALRKAALKAAAAKRAAALRYVRPANGPLTSPYGPRWGRLHAGIDFGAAYGSQIRAVHSGTVTESGFDAGGYGNFVHVQHDDGAVTTYSHMSKVLRRGGRVDTGDVLGLIGATGHSTGPHLHFEVRIGGTPVDPRAWLRRHGLAV